uniref:Protein MAK16 homolog n=1 Tax=Euplotes harpa TaxID=151035 RepID=A0A7S3JH01_9SPIT|mmetsp:Transcript_40066/g.45962  ORF Transcript_40066/g.45962 Transcript_40066/m.45962 type:complete len:145 (+) Transcript_40066:365-799(+)|eukprot:CAMPEP_0168341660 /NCGR_PEP_ID=MMETSP0213-20121227/14851_1 /TAXON_ID=151035 /ORGANISM="Euplotes harpa, Strain FSP1.4" /LENGTH=144 /DNA_ID=CAMNT_0008348249 /DNA_START=364 /DNA_END=798 /DNA_ORIENTATION=-
MIIRRRRQKLNQIEKYEPIKTKFEKREKHREKRAERAANLELSIEKELLNRLKEGVYNLDQKQFEQALNEVEIEDEKEYEVDEELSDEEEESEEEYEKELVEADIDELSDIEDYSEGEGEEEHPPAKQRMIEIEYDVEEPQQQR